jgi:tetratricopeptide (TPR) repeat protein
MSPDATRQHRPPGGADSASLIAQLESALHRVAGGDAPKGRMEGDDVSAIEGIGNDLTDLLRWDGRYQEAISLQRRLSLVLPDQAQRFRIAAATIAIEAGAVEKGLRQLQGEAALMEPVEGKLLLASTLTWLQKHEPAEALLNEIVSDPSVSPADCATAAYTLFQVQNLLRKLPEAVRAWEMAVAIDASYSSTLPELVRAQIYWRDFHGATMSIARDPNEVRRSFYRDLIAARTTVGFDRARWDWVLGHTAISVVEAHEEFAEAALRSVSPQLALDVLMPFVDRQELSRQRLILTGVAWAQLREVERAKWAFQLALRLAEIERPRRTRPGAGTLRIFDAETRITYGEIPVDADVRAYLDHFFMPKAALSNRELHDARSLA